MGDLRSFIPLCKKKVSVENIEAVCLLDYLQFEKEDLKAKAQIRAKNLALATACGLLLSKSGLGLDLNLMPREAVSFKKWNRQLTYVNYGLMGLAGLLFVMNIFWNWRIHVLKSQTRTTEKKMVSFPKSIEASLKKQKDYEHFIAELSVQKKIRNAVRWRSSEELLSEIRAVIPQEVRLTSFQFSKNNQIAVQGQAQSQEAVFQFEKMLKESPYFQNVKIGVVQNSEQPQGKVLFSLSCELEAYDQKT